MPQLSFRCANSRGVVVDQRVAEVASLFDARDYAMALVRSRIAAGTRQDWRKCRLQVSDERGEEIFVMPFWSTQGRPGLATRLKAAFGRAMS
jgi:hypothetical protein